MGERRKSREIALQMLYSFDLGQQSGKTIKKDFQKLLESHPDKKEFAEHPEITAFALELVEGTIAELAKIDKAIKNRLKNWDFERLANVDKNILRVASYELLFREDIPAPVTINEAIEIAKSFSGEEAGKFINGILDNIKKDIKIKKKERAV